MGIVLFTSALRYQASSKLFSCFLKKVRPYKIKQDFCSIMESKKSTKPIKNSQVETKKRVSFLTDNPYATSIKRMTKNDRKLFN